MNIEGKTVLVTGGHGFIGKHLCRKLSEMNCRLIAPTKDSLNLLNENLVASYFLKERPQVVIHLAAIVGSGEMKKLMPGDFIFQNIKMGMNIIQQCKNAKTEKLMIVGAACCYSSGAEKPFKEESLWLGAPDKAVSAYAQSKRALLSILDHYRDQYGLNGIFPCLSAVYGPGDHFGEKRSHVVPSMIQRMVKAKEERHPSFSVFGADNVRDFIFIDDAVDAIIKLVQGYDHPMPINIGTGEPNSIFSMAKQIAEILKYDGEITGLQDGEASTNYATSIRKALAMGIKSKTSFHDGIKQTVEWYLTNRDSHAH